MTTTSGNANFTLNGVRRGRPLTSTPRTQPRSTGNSCTTNTALVPTTSYTLTMTAVRDRRTRGSAARRSISTRSCTRPSRTRPSTSQGPLLTTKPHVIVTDTGCANNKDYPPTQVPTVDTGRAREPRHALRHLQRLRRRRHQPRHLHRHHQHQLAVADGGDDQWITANIYPTGAGPPGPEAGHNRHLRERGLYVTAQPSGRPWRQALARRLRDERGFTLIELLVASLAGHHRDRRRWERS